MHAMPTMAIVVAMYQSQCGDFLKTIFAMTAAHSGALPIEIMAPAETPM